MRMEMKEQIDRVFERLIAERPLQKISITSLCDAAGIGRNEFYKFYKNINDCAKGFCARTEEQIVAQPHTAGEFTWVFNYIKENADTFRIYFQLAGYYSADDYQATFFANGVRAVAQNWLENGFVEPPEQMNRIVAKEYRRIMGE